MKEYRSSQEEFQISLDMDEVLDELLRDAAAILPPAALKKISHHLYQAKVILLADRARRYQEGLPLPDQLELPKPPGEDIPF